MNAETKIITDNAACAGVTEQCDIPIRMHFAELRKKILLCISFFALVTCVVMYQYIDAIMLSLTEPIKSMGIQFIYLDLAEALTAKFKVSIIVGMVISTPLVLFNIWNFIAPGLYRNEKLLYGAICVISFFLFILGVVFGYLAVFLSALTFFVYIGENLATPMLSLDQYVNFLFSFVVPFGLIFEEPILVFILCKLNLVKAEMLIKWRKYVILAAFTVAAFLTPPDIMSQTLMAIPMVILYEISIIIAKYYFKYNNKV